MSEVIEKDGTEKTAELVYSLSFDEKVIKKITGFATGDIPGILAMSGNFISGLTDMLRNSDDPTKGIAVEMNGDKVSISIKAICEYGRNVPSIFKDMVDKISNAVKEMTGMEVVEVKVHVYDILTKEDFERKKKAEEKAEAQIEAASEVLALEDLEQSVDE